MFRKSVPHPRCNNVCKVQVCIFCPISASILVQMYSTILGATAECSAQQDKLIDLHLSLVLFTEFRVRAVLRYNL